ncbi:unnamed protein product [Lactuca virosa]|uniref:non-specific serine/threonine protein kinase n=1 Tax=Lactuca virosa TaxID=75947 RepID=A0AAU9N8T8_9ASTR|nr:unnamed protein product [Lactuca virosa]
MEEGIKISLNMENKKILMQRYEIGKLLGQGTFAKVYHARKLKTKKSVAVKVIEKGGELFNKIAKGRLKEEAARKYFQQLIAAVDYCHSRGYLPFNDPNLMGMYRKISKGEFKCPSWFPPEVKKLLSRILDPNPNTRMTLDKIMENPWFQKGFKKIETHYIPKGFLDSEEVFKYIDSPKCSCTDLKGLEERSLTKSSSNLSSLKPTSMNAFDIITLSQEFNLSGLFENNVPSKKSEARFTTKESASAIVSKLEEVASVEQFQITTMADGTVRMQGCKEGRKGQLAIDAEIFQVTPSIHVVEVKKLAGDTIEYERFRDQGLKPKLKDIVWTWQGEQQTTETSTSDQS